MHQSELLGLVHGAVGLAVDEAGLLALSLRASCLLVLAKLHLVVLIKRALEEIPIGEVEPALHQVVLQHEPIKPGAIRIRLLRLARLFPLKFGALKAILRVISLHTLLNGLDLSRQILCVVAEGLAFGLFELFDLGVGRIGLALEGGVGDALEGHLGENGLEILSQLVGGCLHHSLSDLCLM